MADDKDYSKANHERKKQSAFLIDFGLGGHGVGYAEVTPHGTRYKGNIYGYDNPESFERALTRGEKDQYPNLAGVPVLDKREVLREHPEYSFRSPLVDADVKDGEVHRLDTDAARRMLPGLSGGFDTLAALAITHEGKAEPGPLDTVSVGDYVAWWTSRGARVGRMDGEGLRILWEDQHG